MAMLTAFVQWLVQLIGDLGYVGVALLMAVESSFIPFPSEVILIPAGYLVHEGQMHGAGVMLAALAGTLLGAWVNYAIAATLGRAVLLRHGHWFLLPPERLEKMETFFRRHGAISTFSGRLIPVVRQYISFPAGLSGMPLPLFFFYTGLGGGIWGAALILTGYMIGREQERLTEFMPWITLGAVVLAAGCVALYVWRWRCRARNAEQQTGTEIA